MTLSQPNLFDTPEPSPPDPPAQRHSPTSRAAADQAEPAAPTQRQRLLHHLRQCGEHGATDAEMQQATGLEGDTQRPRRRELVRMELVRDSGRQRPTPAGRMAVVWTVREGGGT